jgi:hypothetical protein
MKLFMTIFAIFVCLMTASSIPIKDDDEDIRELENVITFAKAIPAKAFKKMNKAMNQMNGMMEAMDRKVKALQAATSQIELKSLDLTSEFLDDYSVIRADLRNARFDLRKLARKTVILTEDIKGLLKIWDEKSKWEIQEQFDTLKQFLVDAVPIFKSAEEKYKNAITKLSDSQLTFDLFKVRITHMNTKGTEEYDKWTTTVRAAVYGTAGAGTAGCILSDIFLFTFGACSAIYNSVTWPATIAGVETAIDNYEKELQEMADTSGDILATIGELDVTVSGAIDFLTVELNLIIDWQANSDSIRARVTRLSPAKLKQIESIFARGLDELKASAEAFLARPDKILEK